MKFQPNSLLAADSPVKKGNPRASVDSADSERRIKTARPIVPHSPSYLSLPLDPSSRSFFSIFFFFFLPSPSPPSLLPRRARRLRLRPSIACRSRGGEREGREDQERGTGIIENSMETRTRKGEGDKARGRERGERGALSPDLNAGPGAGGRLISNLSGVGLQPFMLCPLSTASTPFCRANAPAASAQTSIRFATPGTTRVPYRPFCCSQRPAANFDLLERPSARRSDENSYESEQRSLQRGVHANATEKPRGIERLEGTTEKRGVSAGRGRRWE